MSLSTLTQVWLPTFLSIRRRSSRMNEEAPTPSTSGASIGPGQELWISGSNGKIRARKPKTEGIGETPDWMTSSNLHLTRDGEKEEAITVEYDVPVSELTSAADVSINISTGALIDDPAVAEQQAADGTGGNVEAASSASAST